MLWRHHERISRQLPLWDTLYKRLIERSYFPRVADADLELVKLGWLRIACGLVILVRSVLSTLSAWFYFSPTVVGGISVNLQFAWSLVECVLALFLMVGFFTPVSILALILTYAACDRFMSVINLGTMVLIHILVLLLITNSGLRVSLDSLFAGSGSGRLAAAIKSVCSLTGKPSPRQLTAYYFIAFVSFALLNFGALTMHLQSVPWLQGQTVASLLVSSFWSRLYEFFRFLEANWPQALMALSAISGLLETVFQAFMVPLIFSRFGMIFVVAWGGLFCLASLLLLQLSFLPFLETILWAALFLPSRVLVRRAPESAGSSSGISCTNQPGRITRLYAGAYLFGMMLFALNVMFLHIEREDILKTRIAGSVESVMMHLGWWCPDVFNEMDLSTSDGWRVVYRHFPNGTEKRVRLTKPTGERDLYYLFDEILIGNDAPWRRVYQRSTFGPASFHGTGQIGATLNQKLVDFDYAMKRGVKPTRYRIVIMGSATSDFRGQPPSSARHKPRMLYQYFCTPSQGR